MQAHDWHDTHDKAFACVLQSTPRHAPLVLIFNANAHAQAITLPSGEWQLLLDAASPRAADTKPQSGVIHAPAHGVMALRRIKPTRSTPPPSAAAHAHHP
jgi:pullulanase/glycogen debranching enzyme